MAIESDLDELNSILRIHPTGPLETADFGKLSRLVDPFIERSGALRGLLLEIGTFPGWENMGAALRHLRFVRDHHRKVRKVAIVTDSPVGRFAEDVASHFVAAAIRQFPAGDVDAARTWIDSD